MPSDRFRAYPSRRRNEIPARREPARPPKTRQRRGRNTHVELVVLIHRVIFPVLRFADTQATQEETPFQPIQMIMIRPQTKPATNPDASRATDIVSLVIPTINRRKKLERCIDNIRRNVSVSHEVIVVDGGSTDGTREWLAEQNDLRIILEPQREGAVRAFNKGFRAATGQYVMWLNDDAFPLSGSLEAAVAMLERPDLDDIGMVAFYHNWHSERNVLDRVTHDGNTYELCHVRGYPYANFGLLRRSLLERIGFADERYYFFGFDPDLSLKIQIDEGLKVVGCRRALIHHDEHHDERKLGDLETGATDNQKLFAKWNLPAKGKYANPTPAYVTMLKTRSLL